MTYRVILEHYMTQQIKFVTVEDCTDIDDAIDHCIHEFPGFSIDTITEVN